MGVKRLVFLIITFLFLNGPKPDNNQTLAKSFSNINITHSIAEKYSIKEEEPIISDTIIEEVPKVQEAPQLAVITNNEEVTPIIWGIDGIQGNKGRLSLPSVGFSMPLYDNGPESWKTIVDNDNSALYTTYLNKGMIADHSYQGFNAMKNCDTGTIGYIIVGDTIYTIECASKYIGYNNGYRIEINGNYADQMGDGSLYMYTCNDTNRNVTVTFWNIIA